jgi:two-component system response regulator YesN
VVKLLIADDEPLVCVGLRSLLNWEDLGIEIIGTARNGRQAAELIESLRPELVITDIKMPLKSGLELAEECAAKYGKIPLFIILTSFEEFSFVRRAIGVQAVDYLVKLELTPETLSASVGKALAMLELLQGKAPSVPGRETIQALREKFFLRLYNGLFETPGQYRAQKESLGIELSGPAWTALIGEGGPPPEQSESSPEDRPGEARPGENGPGHGGPTDERGGGEDARISLYTSAIQMARETLEKKHVCQVSMLDIRRFAITFRLESTGAAGARACLEEDLRKTIGLVHAYFGVHLRMAVGKAVAEMLDLDESYRSARRLLWKTTAAQPLVFWDEGAAEDGGGFAFRDVRPALRRAFEALDAAALTGLIARIRAHFENRPDLLLEALDAASSILYMAISLLPGGEETAAQIFSGHPAGYRSLYRLNSTGAVMDWLQKLGDGCAGPLRSQQQDYKRRLVAGVQDYIRHNLGKRISLHDTAAAFNLSPNYLSRLFTKHAGMSFVEYITAERISAAREMLARGEGAVYEIAEKLGYENAFYFSKVFKKVEGLSPREFLRTITGRPEAAPPLDPAAPPSGGSGKP